MGSTRWLSAVKHPARTVRNHLDPAHPVRSIRLARYRASGFRRFRGPVTDLIGWQPYQPLYGLEEQDHPETRAVLSRWEAMQPHLPPAGSALDIGCMNGWFTFALAEHGLIALGVDANERDIQTPRLLSIHRNVERAAFARLALDPDSSRSLPAVDVVVCLSVFHHLVRFQGLEQATEIMRVLASKARSQLYFETGQPNEENMTWADDLRFMDPDPASWIEDFVSSLGFDEVRRVTATPGYLHGPPRTMVVGLRHGSGVEQRS